MLIDLLYFLGASIYEAIEGASDFQGVVTGISLGLGLFRFIGRFCIMAIRGYVGRGDIFKVKVGEAFWSRLV